MTANIQDRRGGHPVSRAPRVQVGPLQPAPLPGAAPVPAASKPAALTVEQQAALQKILVAAASVVGVGSGLTLPPLQVTTIGTNNIDLQQSLYQVKDSIIQLVSYRKNRGYLFIQNIDAANTVQLFFANKPANSNAYGVKFGPGAAFLFDAVVPKSAVYASPLPGAALTSAVNLIVVEG